MYLIPFPSELIYFATIALSWLYIAFGVVGSIDTAKVNDKISADKHIVLKADVGKTVDKVNTFYFSFIVDNKCVSLQKPFFAVNKIFYFNSANHLLIKPFTKSLSRRGPPAQLPS